jgi:hypothetical protein
MFDWIMRTRAGAWLVALLAAAGLLAIGFGLAGDYYRGELQRWQERATQAEIRANRMQERSRLRLGTGLAAKQPKADSLLPQTIVAELRLAQPAEFLNGRVTLTLEQLNPAAQRAKLRVKVDERQGVVVVGTGKKVSFRLDSILYQLVLRQTGTSSATIALIPQ